MRNNLLILTFSCFFLSLALGQDTNGRWVGTWAAAPQSPTAALPFSSFRGATLRQVVHTSIGGQKVRVRFTNAFGTLPLRITDVHFALSAGDDKIQPATDHLAKFNGESSVKIPAGAEIYSDAVDMNLPAFSDLDVSFYLPKQNIPIVTYHYRAWQTNYAVAGEKPNAEILANAETEPSWYFIDGVDVMAGKSSSAVICFGDSITDGSGSTTSANHRWPNYLAMRLAVSRETAKLSVLDEGLAGNRVLNKGIGESALARFDRDVIAQSGVAYVIILEGINDISKAINAADPLEAITAKDLEMGLIQLAYRAHVHHIKVLIATLTPCGSGAGKGEELRETVNQWIRQSTAFDEVVDFDRAVEDPSNPRHFLPKFDSGDHLHPSDDGYKAMADAIDLSVLK